MSEEHRQARGPRRAVWLGTAALLASMGLILHYGTRQSATALSATPKGVTTIVVQEARYQPSRRYVGTVAPWLEARVGPQLTAALVATVLVRPGDAVRRGQVLATLDCQSASAQSRALAMQAKALAAQKEALIREASRVAGLVEGGFVSTNESERKAAESASKQAELLAADARLLRASLEVDDCVLRAPFDGEVAERLLDPGGFARPGAPLLIVVDRRSVRVLLDAPETDFDALAVGTKVHIRLLALAQEQDGRVSRRAPAADPATRTIHAEIDLDNPQQHIPVGTTAELTIGVGAPRPASRLPLRAATVRGESATVFLVEGGVVRKRKIAVLGEIGGSLFLDLKLAAGSRVVIEGADTLEDGEQVMAQDDGAVTAGGRG